MEYLYNEAIDMWTYDLCEVGAHPFIPDEDRPHVCGAFPFDEPTILKLVPKAPAYTSFKRIIEDLLRWERPRSTRKSFLPKRPSTIVEMLAAGRCCVREATMASPSSHYFIQRLDSSLKEYGLDWASSDGHRWFVDMPKGATLPEVKHRQVWSRCICGRLGWQPRGRVLAMNYKDEAVPFVDVYKTLGE